MSKRTEWKAEKCPICALATKKIERRGDGAYVDCGYCGPYHLTGTAEAVLRGTLTSGDPKTERMKAVLSHAIQRAYKPGVYFSMDSHVFERIVKEDWLPSLSEQTNNLILWFGENTRPGQGIDLFPEEYQAIMGAEDKEGAEFVAKYLMDNSILEGVVAESDDGYSILGAHLSMRGWEAFTELTTSASSSKKAFMAMKYGDPELDRVFELFRTAVAQTGFDLVRLDQKPKAGLIDDNLRVQIRTSRFLISDLTHGNLGAYWEAGFAEGLGRPVIYSCRSDQFKEQGTHFDTNHHLTIQWEPSKLQEAATALKQTIRETLPTEAKMVD